MERIHTLIDKLAQQKATNAPAAHLLFTVQLLHKELTQQAGTSGASAQRNVSVTLPVNFNFSEEALRVPFTGPVKEKEVFVLQTDVVEATEVIPASPVVQEYKEYTVPKPVLAQPAYTEPQPVQPKEPVPARLYNGAFETVAEAPTLTQYATRREVHHTLTQAQPSLNDRLKEERAEVVHRLKETPVKDLRKAIGINDRFLFIKELFRGDEAAYERSVKTINNFNIFSEAQYWMARELGLKLAWQDGNETVQHFYGLVRRRFS